MSRKHHVLLLIAAAACLAGFGLLVALRFRNGFWIDELYTLHTIRLPWRAMIEERLQRGHFPGYFVCLRLWWRLFPGVYFQTALRGFSVMCWGLSVLSFLPLARKFIPSLSVAIAVILLALNTMAIRQASEARMYTLVLLISIWILRAYLELCESGGLKSRFWKTILLAGATMGAATSTSIAFLLTGILFDAWRRRKVAPGLFRTAITACCFALLMFVPGLLVHLSYRNRNALAVTEPIQLLVHLQTLLAGIQTHDNYFDATRLLISLAMAGAVLSIGVVLYLIKQRAVLHPTVVICVRVMIAPLALIVLTILLSQFTGVSFLGPPRYLICLLPAATLLTSYVAGRLLTNLPAPAQAAATVAFTIFLLIGDWSILTVRTEAFRERVGYLKQHFTPGDAVIVITHEIEDGVKFYARGQTVDKAVSRWITNRDELRTMLLPFSTAPNVWVVWYRGGSSPLLQVARELWGDYESNNTKKPEGNLRVFRFRPEAGQKPVPNAGS